MIHLISRKYLEDTTDSMLFTPIVKNVIYKAGKDNVTIWAKSKFADIDLGGTFYLFNLFLIGLTKIKKDDTVFVTSTPPFLSLLILLLRIFKKFKIVYQVQDLYPDILKLLSFQYRIAYRITFPVAYFLLKKVNTFITISDCIKNQIIENYSIKPDNIFVVHNWSDIDNFEFSNKEISNKVIYIGNIGKAHDYSYFLDYIKFNKIHFEVVIKTDNTSKISIIKTSKKVLGNGLKKLSLPEFITWNHTRYSKEDLAKFLTEFDYSIVFLGHGFDRILFPCKIYASLSLLMPVIFFGPRESYINKWLETNNLGFHYSTIEQNYKKLNFYRDSIYRFNQCNPDIDKIKLITKHIDV
jgi:hypothetical protein